MINSIKSRSKIQDRVKAIVQKGGQLKFIKNEGTIFQNNLTLIDSLLPKILSEIIVNFSTSNYNKLSDLVREIELKNPLNFDKSSNHFFYNYKITFRYCTWNGSYNCLDRKT